MRNVPELRFDGFDEEWEEYRFNDITKLSQGLQIPIDERYLQPSDDTYFYITNEFLKPGSKKHYYIKNPNKSVIANKDDILMTRTGNTGKVLTDVEGAFHNNFFKISYDNSSISKYYLFYLLNSRVVQNKILRLAGSSTILDLNHKDFYSIVSSFPSLKEQRKIGKIFKKLDAIIETQEGKVAKMEDFKKSMLQKMFPKKGELVPEFRFDGFDGDWEKLTLGDIGEVQSSGVNKIIYNNQKIVKLLNYMDVYNKKSPTNSNIDTFMETSASDKEMLYKDVTKGDIFFTPTSETAEDIGHSMVVEDYIKGMVYSYHIFRFRPNSDVLDINFSDYFCNVDPVRKQLKIKAQGAQRYTLKLNDFRELIIKIPPLAEQEKIGQFFKNLDIKIENEEKLLDSYKMMKKSLLQKMFV